MPLKVARSLAD